MPIWTLKTVLKLKTFSKFLFHEIVFKLKYSVKRFCSFFIVVFYKSVRLSKFKIKKTNFILKFKSDKKKLKRFIIFMRNRAYFF